MRKIAIIQHPDFVEHDTGGAHPESPERIRSLYGYLENYELAPAWEWRRADPADPAWVKQVHDPGYIRFVEEACLSGTSALDSGDTQVCPDSFRVALLAAGAAMEAVDAVLRDGVEAAFSAARPPGHHATQAQAMGFCLFNHAAIAARYAQQQYHLQRVAILDWDVHHGNGTQDIFYDDPSVFFASIHQHPFYPGSGAATERGQDAGLGLTLNCPVAEGAAYPQYEVALQQHIFPAIRNFAPELIIVSAGFDAHRLDPLAHVNLESKDFLTMTRAVVGLAEEVCGGRLVSLLEGGYNLSALCSSVEAHLLGLAESSPSDLGK